MQAGLTALTPWGRGSHPQRGRGLYRLDACPGGASRAGIARMRHHFTAVEVRAGWLTATAVVEDGVVPRPGRHPPLTTLVQTPRPLRRDRPSHVDWRSSLPRSSASVLAQALRQLGGKPVVAGVAAAAGGLPVRRTALARTAVSTTPPTGSRPSHAAHFAIAWTSRSQSIPPGSGMQAFAMPSTASWTMMSAACPRKPFAEIGHRW